jgi:collagenase-like PrtC family protease
MLTRQPFGLAEGERLLAVSEHGHAYRFEVSEGITTLFEARELIGAEALPLLAGRVHAVRLDLAHQGPGAVGEIVRAYREALGRLLEEPDGPGARDAVGAAAEAHRRHAPAGAFTGHLIRGSRLLDRAGDRP